MKPILSCLRDAAWLTDARARAYGLILFGVSSVVAIGWITLSRGGFDALGKPLGTDFLSFWAASALTLAGHPELVYDLIAHRAAQAAVLGREVSYFAFFYPPPFLLICLPLAAGPYLASLGVWLGMTGYACWRVLRGFLPDIGIVTALSFPAVLLNAGHGQNGFLTTALFGGAILTLDRRPVLSGVLFGSLIFKPHLAVVVPVALIFAGAWTTLAAAAAAAFCWCALSYLAFGGETWSAFLAISPLARAALENEWVGSAKMQSTFAALRVLHAGLPIAYAAQGLVTLSVLAALGTLARGHRDRKAYAVAIAPAALLASPFLLDYDLMLLAVPLAWTVGEARRDGFLPYEKTILLAAFVLPMVSRQIASTIGLPLAPLLLLAVFGAVLRRGFSGRTIPKQSPNQPLLLIVP